MNSSLQDLTYGLRQWRRNPGFSAMAVLALTLGIGANTAIFSVVQAVLLRPLAGIQDPGRLVSLFRMQHKDTYDGVGYPDFVDYRDRNKSLSGLVAAAPVSLNLSGDRPERIIGSVVTGNYFSVLGVQSALGRLILPADDAEHDAHPVAVLSDAFWRREFGAARDTVGKTILLNGYPFSVVGVAPRGFSGTMAGLPMQVWVPMSMLDRAMPGSVGRHFFDERAWGWLRVFGRLKPGTTFTQAEAEMKGIARQLELAYPNTNRGRTVVVTPSVGLDPGDRVSLTSLLALLFAGVGLLLLIGCSNVAGMLLVRAVGRQREIAVRLALGASRARLVRQLLMEGLLLALAGGVLGLLLAPWTLKLAVDLTEPASVIRRANLTPDPGILAFTFVLSLVAGILSSLAPALRSSSADLSISLKQGTPGSGRSFGLQNLLVVGQVALSVVLMMAAGLLVRSLHKILTADPGFSSRNIFLATMDLTEQRYSEASTQPSERFRDQDGAWAQAGRGESFYRQLFDRLQTVPGAVSASLATSVPPDEWPGAVSIFHPGEEPPQEVLRGQEFQLGTRVNFVSVAPNYFRSLGIPLLQGRDFTLQDGWNAPVVAIVSRNLAERFWPRQNALGKLISWPAVMGPARAPLEVVGVAADCKYRSLMGDAPLLMYVSLFQNYSPGTTVIVRTASSPMSVLVPVRTEVRTLDKDLPVFGARTMQEQSDFSLWQQRMAVGLISAFGALALLLAALGLYGVMAHSVAQRTRELGIRMALGARRGSVYRLVMLQAGWLTFAGLAIGLLCSVGASLLIRKVLFGAQAWDAVTLSCVAVLLGLASMAGSFLPAHRAASVNPTDALQAE